MCSSCADIVCPTLELTEVTCPPCTALEVPSLVCPPCPIVDRSCPSLACPDCFCDCPDVPVPIVDPGCPTLSDLANLFDSSDFRGKELNSCKGQAPAVVGLTMAVLLLAIVCFCLSAIIVILLRGQRKVDVSDPEVRVGNPIPRSRRRRSKKPRTGGLVIKKFLL